MKNIFSGNIRAVLKLIRHTAKAMVNYAYDACRFMKYSCVLRKKNDLSLIVTYIMIHVHSVERALSLKNVRPGFGKQKLLSLIELLRDYAQLGYDTASHVFITGVSVLDSYLIFHDKKGYKTDIPAETISYLKSFLPAQIEKRGGTKEITRDEYLQNTKADFPALALNRVSIRDFSEEKADIGLIKEAVRIAQKSPSVCNRQSVRVYIIKDDVMLMNSRKMLSGTRGFEHLINQLIVLTSDLSSFVNIGERNQCYVDGGIFLMSLLYGFQSLGLGACTLNWSVEKDKDRALRKACGIKYNENIIALIAVGHLADRFSVPVSSRLDTEEIIKII